MRRLTREELARCDGRDGAPAFIAYQGRVYDVSRSFHWRGGRHQVLHHAGADLTADLDQAPHGPQLLERVPLIGTLDEECSPASLRTAVPGDAVPDLGA